MSIYNPNRFPIGSVVLITGSRDVHSGQIGEVVRPDGNQFLVRIGKVIFRKKGVNLKLITPAPIKEKEKRYNLALDISKAYQRFKRVTGFRAWNFVR